MQCTISAGARLFLLANDVRQTPHWQAKGWHKVTGKLQIKRWFADKQRLYLLTIFVNHHVWKMLRVVVRRSDEEAAVGLCEAGDRVEVWRALHPVPHSHTNPSCFVSILNVVLFLLPGASVRSWVYLWRKVIVLALFVAGSVSVSGCVSLRCFQPVMPFVVCSVFSCLVGLARNALRIESSHL